MGNDDCRTLEYTTTGTDGQLIEVYLWVNELSWPYTPPLAEGVQKSHPSVGQPHLEGLRFDL